MDDIELLQFFAERGSEDAFQTLVDRNINLVYSVARHTARDPHLAEEIVQTVFVILARKAARLGKVKALSGWLYRTTRLAALQAVRNECRRREREEKFANMDHRPSESVWEQIEPHLGEFMDQLSELDRTALVLRFFESKSLKDVARALGTGEDAARMRVNRAIEKLRKLFLKRGVAVSGGALLAAIASNSAQAAPAGLAMSVVKAAVAQTSILTNSALVKGTLKLMAWTKFKTAALTTAALLLLGGTTSVLLHRSSDVRGASVLARDQKAVLNAAESLVDALARGDSDAFAAGLFAPDESERRLAASIGAVARGTGALDAALRKQFGDTEAVRRFRYTFTLMSGIPLLGYQNHRTEIEVLGDDAYFRCPALWPSHNQFPLQFVRSNGEWKLVINTGPRRPGWLERALAQHERGARRHEEFAKEILDGRYKTPQEAWQAWSGYTELLRPAAPPSEKWMKMAPTVNQRRGQV